MTRFNSSLRSSYKGSSQCLAYQLVLPTLTASLSQSPVWMPPPPPPAPLPLNSQCTAEGLTEGCDKSFSNKVNTGLCARCALYQRLYLEPESADRDERARILGVRLHSWAMNLTLIILYRDTPSVQDVAQLYQLYVRALCAQLVTLRQQDCWEKIIQVI